MGGDRGVTLIGGCRERVTSCSGVLGADATERSLQREGHSLLRVLRGETHERGFGAASRTGQGQSLVGSQGKAMSPSEEPTTTSVVIVGYNKGKPFFTPHAHNGFRHGIFSSPSVTHA